jgi:hypothetical protein
MHSILLILPCKFSKPEILGWVCGHHRLIQYFSYFSELAQHPKKFYLSHSGKWMQNGYSLSHSSAFTWTTPGKARNLYGFTGVVQVNVLEWFKENSICIHLPEWLKYIFLGGEDGKFQNSKFFLIPELITFKTSYILRKWVEWMKSYSIFPKSISPKSPNFAPPQFRNRGVFWETKTIFGIIYQNTIKNAKKIPN